MEKIGLFTTIVLFVFSACAPLDFVTPDGAKRTDVYPVATFDAVSISGSISMEVVNGEQYVQVNTYENVFSYLKVEVKNRTLNISVRNVSFTRNPEIKIYVSSDLVNNIKSSGSSDVYLNAYEISDLEIKNSGSSKTTGSLTGSLVVNNSGSSNTNLYLDSRSVSLGASGSSNFYLSGFADNLSINFSGSSKVEAFDLLTQNTTVKASGSSKMNLFVEQTLRVNISGSSNVNYKGNATITEMKLSGSSKVNKVN